MRIQRDDRAKAESPAVIDLFSGCGGASLGFARAGFRIAAALDIDPWACETYRRNLQVEPLQADVRGVTGRDLLRRAGLKRGAVDVLIGCPPCQGFTRHRNGAGAADPRNGLVADYLRIVGEIRPKFLVFENVKGMWAQAHGRRYFHRLMEGLEDLGYHAVWGLLDAAAYGVPQRRERLIVMATRERSLRYKLALPSRTHAPPEQAEREGLRPYRTVRDAIADLPPLQAGEACPTIPNHVAPKHSPRILELIRHVPKDGGSRHDLPKRFWLKCHKNHNGHRDVYGRMRWDAPAPTLTYGCTNPSRGRFIHPEQDRAITPREAARLQTFPDNFVFYGPATRIASHIGNALPVELARRIAEVVHGLLF